MGCGASTATEQAVATNVKPRNPEEKEREQRRLDVLEKYKCTEKDKNRILAYPIFKVPAKYASETVHTIAYVFFGVKDETCTDVTVFFQEPKELETEIMERCGLNFSMIKDPERVSYSKIAFNHSWGGPEDWDTAPNDETHTHTEPYASFSVEKGGRPDDTTITVPRPVLFVNTATHLLGSKSTNGEEEMINVKDYKMYSGNSKQAVEILLRAAEAANPDKKQVSALAQLIPVRASASAKDKKPKPP